MLLVDAMILLIDSIVVVSGVVVIPLILFGLFYDTILNSYKTDDSDEIV